MIPLPSPREPVRRLLVAVAAVFAVGLLLSLLTRIADVRAVDLDATTAMHRWALESDLVATVARAVSRLGSPVTLVVLVVATGVWLLRRGERHLAGWLVAATLAGAVVESVTKVVVGRARPDLDGVVLQPITKSFPSGHAMNTTIVLAAVAVALVASSAPRPSSARLALAPAAVLAVLIGLTRPVLGVHYVSDVLAGWTLGVLWLVLVVPLVAAAAPAGTTADDDTAVAAHSGV